MYVYVHALTLVEVSIVTLGGALVGVVDEPVLVPQGGVPRAQARVLDRRHRRWWGRRFLQQGRHLAVVCTVTEITPARWVVQLVHEKGAIFRRLAALHLAADRQHDVRTYRT